MLDKLCKKFPTLGEMHDKLDKMKEKKKKKRRKGEVYFFIGFTKQWFQPVHEILKKLKKKHNR